MSSADGGDSASQTTDGNDVAVPMMDGGGNDATPLDSGTDANCSYSPAHNDPACPSAYSYALHGQPCAPVGLTCAYPGAGDGTSNGCFATAMAWCRAGDAGTDGGSGTWTVAQ